MRKLFRNTLYLRLQAEQLRILHVESGKSLAEPPELALRNDRKGRRVPLAVGNAALALQGQAGVELANGFRHPRTLLADFAVAAQTLQLLFKPFTPAGLFQVAPTVILQPLEQLEGGLTPIEIRALVELLRGAGARRVFIWTGTELQREQLESLRFPAERGMLLYPEDRAG